MARADANIITEQINEAEAALAAEKAARAKDQELMRKQGALMKEIEAQTVKEAEAMEKENKRLEALVEEKEAALAALRKEKAEPKGRGTAAAAGDAAALAAAKAEVAALQEKVKEADALRAEVVALQAKAAEGEKLRAELEALRKERASGADAEHKRLTQALAAAREDAENQKAAAEAAWAETLELRKKVETGAAGAGVDANGHMTLKTQIRSLEDEIGRMQGYGLDGLTRGDLDVLMDLQEETLERIRYARKHAPQDLPA